MTHRASSEFTLPLAVLREAVAHSDLLPGAYARYQSLLADGLHFFLQRLSPARLRPLLAEQAQLSSLASTGERVVRLLRHSPALHKLGQVVARDHRLQPAFRKRLQQLESMAPHLSSAEALRLLDRGLPGWRQTGIELGPAPLAEGSVAIILPFDWPRARQQSTARKHPHTRLKNTHPDQHPRPSPRRGIFKVLKPGICHLLEQDLSILGALGEFLDEDCARYHLPRVDYRETFDTIRSLLLHEVRLEEEQQHLAEAARLYRGLDWVSIPALLPFCSRHVTAMERLSGAKLSETSPGTHDARRAVAAALAQALVAAPFFSPRANALFHADPHAGNLLLSSEGRVGILDWSLVGRLRKAERVAFLQLFLGGLEMNAQRMAKAIAELAVRPPDPAALLAVLEDSLRQLRWGAAPGLGWLARLFDQLVMRAGVRLPGRLLLFRKTLLTLEGVLADFTRTDARHAWELLDQAVWGAFLEQWTNEWPRRATARFHTRAFRTNLSNSDLLGWLCETPATLTRWWTQTGLDLLQAASRVMISTTGRSGFGADSEKAR